MNDNLDTKLARIEGKLDRPVAGAIAVSRGGSVAFRSMAEVMEMSKLMAIAQQAIPNHLRGNPGLCLGIVMQAIAWEMEPFAVARKSYVVNDNLAYESQLIHAVIEARAPLRKRLRCSYTGDGADRQCIVSGVFVGEDEPHEYTTPKLKDIPIKNSPLWKWDVDQQLFYFGSRAWARKWCPDVLLGVYSPDEAQFAGDHATPIERIHNPLEDDGPRPIIDKGNDPGPHPLDADEGPVKDLRADEPDGAVIEGDEAEKALTESAQNITRNITDLGDEAARALTEPTPISSKTGEREDDPDEIAHESATDTADYDPETGEVFDTPEPKPEPVAEQPKTAPAPAAKPAAGRRPRPVPPQARAAAAGEPKAEVAPKAAPAPKAAQEGNPAAGIVLADPIRRTAGEYLDYLRKWTAAFVGDPIALRDRYSTSDRTIRNALGTPLNDDEFKEAKAIALAAFKRLGGEAS